MANKTKSTSTLLAQLKNPFDPRFVKWRVGTTSKDKTKGIALAYIDAREVMKRLDEVCGIAGWQKKSVETATGYTCAIGIKIDGEWIWKDDAAGFTQYEATKGGASDAFKRAAANWGVGRYLYYLPNNWMAIKPQGKSYVLSDTPKLPEWAASKNYKDWESIAEDELANHVENKPKDKPLPQTLTEQEVQDINDQLDAMDTTDKMRIIKKVTGKIKLDPKDVTDFTYKQIKKELENNGVDG